jgi:hypothetical protein
MDMHAQSDALSLSLSHTHTLSISLSLLFTLGHGVVVPVSKDEVASLCTSVKRDFTEKG